MPSLFVHASIMGHRTQIEVLVSNSEGQNRSVNDHSFFYGRYVLECMVCGLSSSHTMDFTVIHSGGNIYNVTYSNINIETRFWPVGWYDQHIRALMTFIQIAILCLPSRYMALIVVYRVYRYRWGSAEPIWLTSIARYPNQTVGKISNITFINITAVSENSALVSGRVQDGGQV